MKIGTYQRLKAIKFLDFGVYLLEELTQEEVLLPKRYVPEGLEMGAMLEVFLYTDSEDRPVATTLKPKAILGEVAALEVVSVSERGCYLDLGIAKDIFMPCKNPYSFHEGQKVVVRLDLDKEKRLIARIGVKNYLQNAPVTLRLFTEVEILPFEWSTLGYGCMVNGRYFGMLFNNETFEKLPLGETRKGYIKAVRPDGKIDLSLRKSQGAGGLKEELEKLMKALQSAGGRLELHYDSDPDEISKITGLSKKGFKRALGEAIRSQKVELVAGKGIKQIL